MIPAFSFFSFVIVGTSVLHVVISGRGFFVIYYLIISECIIGDCDVWREGAEGWVNIVQLPLTDQTCFS